MRSPYLFDELNRLTVEGVCLGAYREQACRLLLANHYLHSLPSGKTHFFSYQGAIVAFSIPANQFIGRFLFGESLNVWELSRLWAPDGHEKNLLTKAISRSVSWLRELETKVASLVAYADPNVGHTGGIYRAASWIYTGMSDDSRYYIDSNGQTVSRRKFHSGSKGMTKAEIELSGYREMRKPGKHRFVRCLAKRARKMLMRRYR